MGTREGSRSGSPALPRRSEPRHGGLSHDLQWQSSVPCQDNDRHYRAGSRWLPCDVRHDCRTCGRRRQQRDRKGGWSTQVSPDGSRADPADDQRQPKRVLPKQALTHLQTKEGSADAPSKKKMPTDRDPRHAQRKAGGKEDLFRPGPQYDKNYDAKGRSTSTARRARSSRRARCLS